MLASHFHIYLPMIIKLRDGSFEALQQTAVVNTEHSTCCNYYNGVIVIILYNNQSTIIATHTRLPYPYALTMMSVHSNLHKLSKK